MKTIVRIYLLGRKRAWRWQLLDARNRRVIGASNEGYKNRHAAVANLWRVVGVMDIPRIPYGTKDMEWVIQRDMTNGTVHYIGDIA